MHKFGRFEIAQGFSAIAPRLRAFWDEPRRASDLDRFFDGGRRFVCLFRFQALASPEQHSPKRANFSAQGRALVRQQLQQFGQPLGAHDGKQHHAHKGQGSQHPV